jgi:hypothetical protein
MAIWVHQDAKRGNSLSAQRYRLYQSALTIGAMRPLAGPKASADLRWDLQRGFIMLLPRPEHMDDKRAFPTMGAIALGGLHPATANEYADQKHCVCIMLEQARAPVSQETKAQTAEREMARLEALEEFPPGHSDPPLLGRLTSCARLTTAYRVGEVRLRLAVAADEHERPTHQWARDEDIVPPFSTTFDMQPTVAMLAGSAGPTGMDPRLVPPESVAAARKRPDYKAPHGWERAMCKEGSKEIDVETHSSCADDISNRFVTALAPVIEAHQTSIDVGGAYFHGTPPAMEDGGRAVFAVVPYWLHDFGPYPEKNPNGSRNLLRITGNMPGRCDAGRIWQARFDIFLRSYGLRQLITDPRIWVDRTARGTLIVHDHVDDSRLTSTTDAARSHFYRAWAAEFNSPPEPAELSENFTGLRHQRVGPFTIAISCMGVIRQLVDLIAAHPALNGSHHDIPLPIDALSRLREGPTAAHPLCPDRLEMAQRIAGTIGFITNMTRPDAHFAYCTLSRYLSDHKLTTRVFAYLVRVGRYITSTKELCLHLTAPPIGQRRS